MTHKPILIIQMQRLGDMILSFPLMGRLSQLYPETPLWVVGEKRFFAELMDVSPSAVFFEHNAASALRQNSFRSVINISHRPESLALAGSLDTEELVGSYTDASGNSFIRGNWQLYRASLVNNNRYNLFHWADINALDSVPYQSMRSTLWPAPRDKAVTSSAHVGLFLGASESDKHPDASFWAELAKELLHAGHRPVLLGGEAEKTLGRDVSAMLGTHALNLTGHFSLRELALFMNELDLFVTPDTGPMHLAVWTGTPVLNLSTGPVNAWETGPFSPGHYVLRAALPCIGCWHCIQGEVLCKQKLHPKRTAFLIHELVTKKDANLHRIALPGQELLRTGRNGHNLFAMNQIMGEEMPRQITAELWQAYFGHVLGSFPEEDLKNAWAVFAAGSPGNTEIFVKALVKFSRDLSLHLRRKHTSPVMQEDFWASFPLPLRPLTSYLHLLLQNGLYKNEAVGQSLAMIEKLTALL
ncbi:MAG: hypothetical protein DELT_00893 [Desulfovibrio sp.]